MNRPIGIIFAAIIVNALLWGFAMIMCAHTLKGTGAYQEIQHILGGCAAASLVVVGGSLAGLARRMKEKE